MKNSIKSFSMGLIIGITISMFSGIVFARNLNMKNIDVYSGGIKVIVNGEEIGLSDVLNNNVEPFLYSGTTYVPIRAISETLNKIVLWNNENSNVDIKIKNIDKNNIKSYYEDIKLLNDMKLHYAYSKYYKAGNEYSDLGEVMLCFTVSEKNKSVNISFSENRDLLLDYYHLKKENVVSRIRNNSAIIIDNTRGGYGVSFNKDGLNYCVEATGYSIQEVVELIENIFESKIGTIMEIAKAG